MWRGVLASLLLMPLALLAAPERVELPGVPAVGGHWHAAPGPQPRPAVVALHGCNGPYDSRGELNELQRRYAADLNAAGAADLIYISPDGEYAAMFNFTDSRCSSSSRGVECLRFD